ncbi:MAG: hypothetical protein AAFY59_01955 [Pseudomonadota bacterium]
MRLALSILSALLAVAATYFLARDLIPPDRIVFAAGPPESGYASIARAYQSRLARDGIALEILHTEGSVENAEALREGRADVALLQGGIEAPDGTDALAALFYEPLFVFSHAGGEVPANPGQWAGLTIATGSPGSGTRAAANTFLAAAGHSLPENTRDPRGGQAAATALLARDIDAALFVAPLSAPYLAPLFEDPNTRILALDHVNALSRRLPQSTVVRMPAGAVSLAPTVPPEPVDLIAMVAHLTAQADLHPALVDRLIEAARRIHGRRDALTEENAFPTTEGVAEPVDPYARNLLRDGTSPLQQYLPYWITAQINRVLILALPILFLLFPLLRALPGLYRWRMRARVWRHYSVIREIDAEARDGADAARLQRLDAKLEDLDGELANLELPLAYRDYAYTARLHIDLIRKRIHERLAG